MGNGEWGMGNGELGMGNGGAINDSGLLEALFVKGAHFVGIAEAV